MITDLQYTDCRYIDTAYPQTNPEDRVYRIYNAHL